MFERSMGPLNIDLLVLPDTNLILLASVIEPLRGANRISGNELYQWQIFSPDGLPVTTTSAITIPVRGSLSTAASRSPLFVLASYNWRQSATSSLKRQLSHAARHRPLIAGIESGTWLLAEASLLDGLSATVHWEDYEDFALAYPNVSSVKDRYVIDGKRLTTSGSLPTVDLMLELIRHRQGYSLALEVSRLFRYEQRQFHSEDRQPSGTATRCEDDRVSKALHFMEENIEQPLLLEKLARKVGVSARHLQDLFQASIGASPHEHYLALRLNAARRRVIETNLPFADIAAATGFNSASAFSRCYKQSYGESPTETRARLHHRVRAPGVRA